MSPKSGRCPNGGTSVPKKVMEQVDSYVVTDLPGVDVLEASYAIWLSPDPINEALKTE
jgi:hypothetical protein